MTTSSTYLASAGSVVRGVAPVARYLVGWRGPAALLGTTIVAGLAFSWSWLVAAGIALLLFTVLPCIAICALGLCMNRAMDRSRPIDSISAREGGSSAAGANLPGSVSREEPCLR